MDLQTFVEKILPALLSVIISVTISVGGFILNVREHRSAEKKSERSDLQEDYDRVKGERDALLKEKEEWVKKCQDCPEVKRLQAVLDEVLSRKR